MRIGSRLMLWSSFLIALHLVGLAVWASGLVLGGAILLDAIHSSLLEPPHPICHREPRSRRWKRS